MSAFVKCKVCGNAIVPEPKTVVAVLKCCGGKLHWCGYCDPAPFPTVEAFLAKFKRLHAVVCKGKKGSLN